MMQKHFYCLFFLFIILGCSSSDESGSTSVDEGPDEENTTTIASFSSIDLINISESEATISAALSSDGGTAITSKGICWSLSPNPTIDDEKIEEGAGVGSFETTITNLDPETSYFVRAYATNSEGTSYSTELSIETPSLPDYTLIPDPLFEQELINLGHDFGPIDGRAITSDLEEITSLSFELSEIADLTGIEACINLEYFTFKFGPNLNSLDLTNSPELALIDVYYNENLSTLTIASLNIYALDIYNNNLTTLDVSNSLITNSLNVGSNQLTSLDLSNQINMKNLYAENNSLESISLPSNNELVNVSLGGNNLTSLDVSDLNLVERLEVTSNNLSALDVTSCTSLEYLFCEANQIEDLDISNAPNFIFLNYTNNNMINLNFQNDNYLNMDLRGLENPNIDCIQVNDVNYAIVEWSFWAGAFEPFSLDCYN